MRTCFCSGTIEIIDDHLSKCAGCGAVYSNMGCNNQVADKDRQIEKLKERIKVLEADNAGMLNAGGYAYMDTQRNLANDRAYQALAYATAAKEEKEQLGNKLFALRQEMIGLRESESKALAGAGNHAITLQSLTATQIKNRKLEEELRDVAARDEVTAKALHGIRRLCLEGIGVMSQLPGSPIVGLVYNTLKKIGNRELECSECKQLLALDQGRETYVQAVRDCFDFVVDYKDDYHPLGLPKRIGMSLVEALIRRARAVYGKHAPAVHGSTGRNGHGEKTRKKSHFQGR